MKTVGVRALRENPGLLSQCAAVGELLLVTNRSDPVSIALPFNDDLLRAGVQVHLAVKLYEDGVLTLAKAGVHIRLLSDLRTALTVTDWVSPATWCGTSKIRPVSAEVNTQLPPAAAAVPRPQ